LLSVVAVVLALGASAFGRGGTGAGAAALPPPVANLSVMPTSGPAPLRATFDGSTSTINRGAISGWTLAFGDGSASIRGTGVPRPNTATHVYRKAGIYT